MKIHIVESKKANELLQNSKPMPVMTIDQIADEITPDKDMESESGFSLDDLEIGE